MIKHAETASAHGRREQILAELAARGACSVQTLARRFNVSGMTIRRDLQDLADAGRVLRTHGGAAPADRVSFEFRFLERARELGPQKRAIAAAAAALVGDGQTVMLDSGTTTLALAKTLKSRRNLTVITTSLPIASELFGCEHVRMMLLGGFLQHDSPDLIGAITESNLEQLRADIAFIGVDGLDEKGQAFNQSPALGRMLARMAAACRQVYIVADHSKLGRNALYRFGDVGKWTGLITDSGISHALIRSLKRAGVNIIKAPVQEEEPTS